MEYRKLGNSGLRVSQLSFGSWITFGKQIDVSLAKACIKYAFDSGVNFFDNAEVYALGKAENVMGQAFKDLGISRNEYVLTTKFFWGIENRVNFKDTLNRKYLMQAIDGSLHRLGTDFVDVVYCHRYDPETPISEIVFAMDQMIRDGKALYWGTSEWPASAINEAYDFAVSNGMHRPIVEQPQYNLVVKNKVETEFAPLYQKMKLGLTTWSPLASGLLTGKYLNGIPEGTRASMPSLGWLKEELMAPHFQKTTQELKKISDRTGISMAHLAIGFCTLNPHVSTVILGASSLEQLKDNLDALKYLKQIGEIKKDLDQL
ncbi:MAG: alcohol dehydrogenase [Bdellovibrionales bacterium RIFCSPHIGHO2_01_FULL_40_29]|nr:MAG: alcohol dehydrogenase [Bdellovibrionales bacterium RIFCSPHIGHO2_01_FULL_40_29]OFZ35167.1 MAG: alcohol dehydrogenase [Bdellovibrionales bacterium RIFCSPHIGHO2_02_FULL_40_15]